MPTCITVNLKNGYGGRTMVATTNPMSDPDMVPQTTLKGINHLHNNNNGCLIIEVWRFALERHHKKSLTIRSFSVR